MPDDPKQRRTPLKLARGPRAVSWVFGFAGLGLGGTDSFIGHLEAPPVALLGAGTVFTLIGMSGYLPRRMKMGENEIEWADEVGDALGRLAVAAGPDKEREVEEALEEVAAVAPAVAVSAQRRMLQESRVRDAIVQAGAKAGCKVSIGHVREGERLADGQIENPHGLRLWVIVEPVGIRSRHASLARELLAYLRRRDPAWSGVMVVGAGSRGVGNANRTVDGWVVTVDLGPPEGADDIETLDLFLRDWSNERPEAASTSTG